MQITVTLLKAENDKLTTALHSCLGSEQAIPLIEEASKKTDSELFVDRLKSAFRTGTQSWSQLVMEEEEKRNEDLKQKQQQYIVVHHDDGTSFSLVRALQQTSQAEGPPPERSVVTDDSDCSHSHHTKEDDDFSLNFFPDGDEQNIMLMG
jgi:hypothetical protein